jgi:hypothetical protein
MKQLLILILATAVMVSGCGPSDAVKPNELNSRYATEFGTMPSTDIEVKQSRVMMIRDWSGHWLLLHVKSNTTIDKVILPRFTKKESPLPAFTTDHGRHAPAWWTPPPASKLEFYECDQWVTQKNVGSIAQIAVDRSQGMVYFLHNYSE